MNVSYVKMQGAGNQILVVDQRAQEHAPPSPQQLRKLGQKLGDKSSGPGFDQLMWLTAPADDAVQASYRVFNADGSEVEQCGNGVRCVASYLSNGEAAELRLQSPVGPISARVLQGGQVSVSMGSPSFEPRSIPFDVAARAPHYLLHVGGEDLEIHAVSMGNPHCVLRVGDVQMAPVAELGRQIERHPRFPERTNVGFMQIIDRERIALRVFERGVGETLACGTGACAAVVTGQQLGLLSTDVQVSLPGGQLMVSWRGDDDPVWLTGNAEQISKGTIEL